MREPDVIRLAPVPLYNTFAEVRRPAYRTSPAPPTVPAPPRLLQAPDALHHLGPVLCGRPRPFRIFAQLRDWSAAHGGGWTRRGIESDWRVCVEDLIGQVDEINR